MMTRTAIHPLKIVAALGAAFLLWGLVLAYASSPAWAETITVNSRADDADGTDGECTLREAITAANTDTASGAVARECAKGSGADVIDIGGRGTVSLTEALPDLASNIAIEGPGADVFTVRRDTGSPIVGDFRIFTVSGGSVVSISGITITNGSGGIENDRSTLTVTDSTISENSANRRGGGVVSDAKLSGETTTITNSTISGNSAGRGGGVDNVDGLAVIEHSTITNNTAQSGQGSRVASWGDTLTRTEVLSTIISANTNTDVDFVEDTSNSFLSEGYNLIGDGNATAAFNRTGDQPGVTNPLLDSLGFYGGPTPTHRLQSESPAIDAGPPTDSDPIACPPPATDQRGVERPQDGDDDETATCDIGAFELVPPPPPALSIGDVRVTEGDSGTTSNATFTVSLSRASTQTVTANYSTADVTATAGADYQGINPTTLTFAAGQTSRTVDITVNGDDEFEPDETFLVDLSSATNATTSDAQGIGTITNDDPPPNTAPTAELDSYSTNEDTTLNVAAAQGVLANDTDRDPGDTLTAVKVTDPSHGTLTLNADGSFDYTPDANFNGPDSFDYAVSDGNGRTDTATVNITVNAVNDAPSFAAGADQTVAENSGAQTISGWATGISAGPANETGQNVSFVVTNDNEQLFSAQPSIASNGTTGTLTYTPQADKNGSATVTVKATDDGGTPNDPSDDAESAEQTFTITVTPLNDAPTANNGTASMDEDAAPITINFADLVSDMETADANLTYDVSIAPADAGKGTLASVAGDPTKRTFDSAENFIGTVTIDYTVVDRGDPDDCGPAGTNCAAAAKSASGTVKVTVTPVNDAPTVAVAAGGACGTNDRSGTINLAVKDPDGQQQTASLKLSATSNNTTLVPNTNFNLTFGGAGATRTLRATALSGRTGTALITVTVSDGTATDTTSLTLQAGGNSNDTLGGTSATDILLGQNGEDTLRGVGGNDLMCGGRGNDRLSGGGDADRFEGGSGNDRATDFTASEGDTKDNTVKTF